MLIPTTKNVKTITDMREDALGLLNLVQKNGLAYIFHRSQPMAVLMNIEDFVTLQNAVEDLEDYMTVQELKKEPRGKGIPLEEVAKKYGL
jgi:predicted DNA-binding transcriptional regulator